MSRYSDEPRQDIVAMIRETLRHVDATLADRSHDQAKGDAQAGQLVRLGEPPPEDRAEHWTREAKKQEERFAKARAARARNMQLARASSAAVYEQRIAKVEAQLLSVIRAMGKVAENVQAELRELRQEGAETDAQQIRLQTKLGEVLFQISRLCEIVAADCKSILALPALLPERCESADDREGSEPKQTHEG
jgi:hypothetical protein